MKNSHIAIVATVAGLAVAPSAAHAQEAEMLALSAQVTVVVDGASYGYTGGRLTPATVRQVRMAMRGIIQGAVASSGRCGYRDGSSGRSRGLRRVGFPAQERQTPGNATVDHA